MCDQWTNPSSERVIEWIRLFRQRTEVRDEYVLFVFFENNNYLKCQHSVNVTGEHTHTCTHTLDIHIPFLRASSSLPLSPYRAVQPSISPLDQFNCIMLV